MGLAFCGIGILTYTLTSVTAFAVDGDLRERWRRRKMQKDIDELRDHYIVCGWGGIASEIVTELAATGRRFVLIVEDAQALKRQMGDQTPPCVLEGDVADEDLLRRAGIARAAGVFATAADPVNVVISLTARQMSSAVRIVASVSEARNSAKMMRAGANSVVSTVAIGALRMASEMVRPAVVSFLDTMLRSRAPVLRVEEVRIADRHEGAALRSLELDRCAEALLMAVKTSGQWSFNPSPDYKIARGDVLIFMTSPAVEAELKRRLS